MMTSPHPNSPVCYLLEHSHGVVELSLERDRRGRVCIYKPQGLKRISGSGTILLRAESVIEAIGLGEWMSEHFEVFTEGLVSPDS